MLIYEQAKSLLDFNQKLDINLLDGVVNFMYSGSGDSVRTLLEIKAICKNFIFLNN